MAGDDGLCNRGLGVSRERHAMDPGRALGGSGRVPHDPAVGAGNGRNQRLAPRLCGHARGNQCGDGCQPVDLGEHLRHGYDAADANIQFIHNSGSGGATKIDLGASFPKPNADRSAVYEIALFAPPGPTQVLSYEVTDLVSGAAATGNVTSNLPAATQLLTPWSMVSVGGVSSVVGIAVMGLYIESDS